METTLKQMKLIHLALIGGSFMHLIVFLFVIVDIETLQINWNNMFLFVLMFMWVIPFAGKVVYDKIKASIKEEDSEEHKINQYRTAKIIILAMTEGLALFSTTLMMIQPNLLFLISSLCAIGLLVVRRPTSYEMLRDFKIGNELN